MTSLLALAARVGLSSYFLVRVFYQLLELPRVWKPLQAAGISQPALVFGLGAALSAGGGLLVLLGARTRWGVIFLVGAWAVAQLPWNYPGLIPMLKEAAILAGLAHIAAFGPGRFSLDGR